MATPEEIKALLLVQIDPESLFKETPATSNVPLSRRDTVLRDLAHKCKVLEDLYNMGTTVQNGRIVHIRHQITRIHGMKIDVRSDEHPPPHFHVIANDLNASFCISQCSLLKGSLAPPLKALVEHWYKKKGGKELLVNVWNETRPANCPVGPILT